MNPFTDLIPTRYRKYLYALAALASYLYAAWEASQHNWQQFAASLLAALVTTLAHANTAVEAKNDNVTVVGPLNQDALALDPPPMPNAPAPVEQPELPFVPPVEITPVATPIVSTVAYTAPGVDANGQPIPPATQ